MESDGDDFLVGLVEPLKDAVDKRIGAVEQEISTIATQKIPDLYNRLVTVTPTTEYLLLKQELEKVKRSLELLEKASKAEAKSP